MSKNINKELEKILNLGIEAAAATVEKSKEVIDDLVDKGDLTRKMGKVYTDKLKDNIKETINEIKIETELDEENEATESVPFTSVVENLEKLSPEERKKIKDNLNKIEDETASSEDAPNKAEHETTSGKDAVYEASITFKVAKHT